jgi:hypothetical protein
MAAAAVKAMAAAAVKAMAAAAAVKASYRCSATVGDDRLMDRLSERLNPATFSAC